MSNFGLRVGSKIIGVPFASVAQLDAAAQVINSEVEKVAPPFELLERAFGVLRGYKLIDRQYGLGVSDLITEYEKWKREAGIPNQF